MTQPPADGMAKTSRSRTADANGVAPGRSAGAVDLPAMVERYESSLIRYVGQLLRPSDPDVEDIVQDAFLRMHRFVGKHGPTSIDCPSTWLFKVARNLTMDTLRKRKVRKEGRGKVVADAVAAGQVDGLSECGGGTGGGGAGASDGVDTLGDMERREAIDRAMKELDNLPPHQKEAVLLKMIDGMTIRQISKVTGVSIGNVGYRINKGLAELSRRLKQAGVI